MDSPVDEVIFLQVLAAAGNVPGHVQKVQHGQGGGLVLWGDRNDPLVRSSPGREDLKHKFSCPQGGQTCTRCPPRSRPGFPLENHLADLNQ